MSQAFENEAVEIKPAVKTPRNYELDFLRVVFAIMIFFDHTRFNGFIGPNTRFKIQPMLGEVAVHFFFIASGMLMVKSILKQSVDKDFGKAAIDFVLRKFKSIAWILVVSGAICVGLHIYIRAMQLL